MIVPELPAEIRELKHRVGRFVVEEVYPLEARIAQRGSIDPAEVDTMRRKAFAASTARRGHSPSRAPAPTWPASRRPPCGKATTGC